MMNSLNRQTFTLLVLLISVLRFQAQEQLPGHSSFSSNGYVEYIKGNLPIIISAPHGGELKPKEIPDRDCENCVTTRDARTQELAREITAAIFETTGCFPHVIINKLHRVKLDANRAIEEAALGNALAEAEWWTYHEFIDSAKSEVDSIYSKGLFIDLHGHAHVIQRLELGYLLSASDLRKTDEEVDNDFLQKCSVKSLAEQNIGELSLSGILRGENSLGSLTSLEGYPAVPSSLDLFPKKGESYFSGGYNTKKHGSRDGGNIDAIQIECNNQIRFDDDLRIEFAQSLSMSLLSFLDAHYFENMDYCNNTSAINLNEKFLFPPLFPNPVCDQLFLNKEILEFSVQVYHLSGKKLLEKKINVDNPISLGQLDQGIYFIHAFKNDEFLGVQKVIKTCTR